MYWIWLNYEATLCRVSSVARAHSSECGTCKEIRKTATSWWQWSERGLYTHPLHLKFGTSACVEKLFFLPAFKFSILMSFIRLHAREHARDTLSLHDSYMKKGLNSHAFSEVCDHGSVNTAWQNQISILSASKFSQAKVCYWSGDWGSERLWRATIFLRKLARTKSSESKDWILRIFFPLWNNTSCCVLHFRFLQWSTWVLALLLSRLLFLTIFCPGIQLQKDNKQRFSFRSCKNVFTIFLRFPFASLEMWYCGSLSSSISKCESSLLRSCTYFSGCLYIFIFSTHSKRNGYGVTGTVLKMLPKDQHEHKWFCELKKWCGWLISPKVSEADNDN